MSRKFFSQQNTAAHFQEQGYAIIHLLNAIEVSELKSLLSTLLFTYDNNADRERCNYNSSLFETDNEKRIKLFDEVSKTLQPALQKHLSNFDVIMVNYWNKMKGEGAVEIHQNWSHTEEPDAFTITVWIPLQDVSRLNGTIEVVPNSHQKFDSVRGINFGNPFLEISDKIIANDLVAIDMKAGEAVCFDDSLLHFTGPNKTDQPREAVQLVIKPKDAPARFYYRHLDKTEKNVEVFDATPPFYSLLQITSGKTGRPEHGESLGCIDYKNEILPYSFLKKSIQSHNHCNFKSYLEQELSETLQTIKELQLSSGEFKTYEHYPTIEQGKWIEGPSSPFITSTVLLSLLEIEHPTAKEILNKGAMFIQSMEEDRLWKFWKNGTSENDVPADADDTSLCSYVLQQIKKQSTDNKKLFASNRNDDGLFYTWFLPRLSFLQTPSKLISLIKDASIAKSTIAKGFLHKDDVEIAVMANVLLYLGENQITLPAIKFIIETIKTGSDYSKHFYANDIFVWYHISRACKHSIPQFKQLSDSFASFFQQKIQSLDLMKDLPLGFALYNSACNFNQAERNTKFLRKILDEAASGCNYPYPYFNSKNGIYNAGTVSLTLSWYAELLDNTIRNTGK